MEKTTNTLTSILKKSSPEQVGDYLDGQKDELLTGKNPFGDFMRETVRKNGFRLQEIFLRSDISEGYGYKLVSGEKHTRQRDVIIKMCLAGRFTLEETQRALKIYGMSPLYARFPRDAVLIVAVNSGRYEPADVNRMLRKNGQGMLKGAEEADS